MMNGKGILMTLLLSVLVCSCGGDLKDDGTLVKPGGNTNSGNGQNGGNGYSAKDGVAYMFDGTTVPKIHISVSLEEWNKLLQYYDADHNTSQSVVCSVRYDKAGDVTEISDCALRLRGNTSRRRPEGSVGQMHQSGNTDWHHCHFQVNFRKFIKDDAHELHGARKVILKWFKDDPSYVRELYCYDLFRRAGVWTGVHSAYCKLYIHVGDDPEEAYFGIYNMIEPIDDEYLKVRKEELGGKKDGFLWKCRYGTSLNSTGADFGADLDDGKEHTYELKTCTDSLDQAVAQIKDFILKLNGKSDESFKKWIATVCDVELLIKTYAVNVCVGMWDDYWNNMNNWYLYFDSHDTYQYKFYFIPYDYDNTLGTSSSCGVISDSGRHDPFNWGSSSNPLIYRILKIPEYREAYRQELLRLTDQAKPYFGRDASVARIQEWQSLIREHVSNDTGEDMSIKDEPASWSNHREYRLLDSNNNFFTIRSESIKSYCK